MTFTWKIEKPCKYSNWKKHKENYLRSLHSSVVSRGDGAEPLWLQVETVSLSSSQHLFSCSGLTPTKEYSKSSAGTLKVCPWKNHSGEAHLCRIMRCCTPFSTEGSRARFKSSYWVLIYEAEYFPDEFWGLVSSFLKERIGTYKPLVVCEAWAVLCMHMHTHRGTYVVAAGFSKWFSHAFTCCPIKSEHWS